MINNRPALKLSLSITLVLFFLAGFAASCTPARYILATADNAMARDPLRPDLLASFNKQDDVITRQDWQAHREHLLDVFAREIYGPSPPPPVSTKIRERIILDTQAHDGKAQLERWTLNLILGDSTKPIALKLGVLWPKGVPAKGVMLIPNECGLRAGFASAHFPSPEDFRPSYCGSVDNLGGPPWGPFKRLFGEYLTTPPLKRLAERGYVTIIWHESQIAPDSKALWDESLVRLGLVFDQAHKPGIISLWAWTISAVISGLETDPRLDSLPLMSFGHSRRGKAVLLAAARDERLDLVISHQSGTAGGAPHNDPVGEPVGALIGTYPHWFTPHFTQYKNAEDQIPVNQHQLIALIAPRSVHLGGSKRDTWADPVGAELAAHSARKAWELYDVSFDNRVSTHMRNGTHGIHGADWDAFFDAADRLIKAQN